MNVIDLTVLGAGGILIYSAVTNRNPIAVVKAGMSGTIAPVQGIPTDAQSATLPPGKQIVGGTGVAPGTPTPGHVGDPSGGNAKPATYIPSTTSSTVSV